MPNAVVRDGDTPLHAVARPNGETGTMTFQDSQDAQMNELQFAEPAPAETPPARTSRTVDALLHAVEVDHSRDALLTDFGKDTLKDRYLLPGESYQDLFVR
ncbi:MAG: hypothetical protein DI632_08990, partial [Sphingomonas hengshuiensis]